MKSRSVKIVLVSVLLAGGSPAMATLEFCGGGHVINYPVGGITEVIVGGDQCSYPTTLYIYDGADIFSLESYNDSTINIHGGDIFVYDAHDNSQVYISNVDLSSLDAYDDSQVTFRRGDINGFDQHDNSRATISGGSMTFFSAGGSSQTVFSGGAVRHGMTANDNSQVDVYAGIVQRTGGTITTSLNAGRSGRLSIYGSDFAVDGRPVGYLELTSILGGISTAEPARRLTGTLFNGQPINSDFRIGNDARIVLVPEPATLLLLGIGGLMLHKRRYG